MSETASAAISVAFHGVTLGPLSLVGDEFFKEGFGPLLPGCQRVPFGDLARLGGVVRHRRRADSGRVDQAGNLDTGARGQLGAAATGRCW